MLPAHSENDSAIGHAGVKTETLATCPLCGSSHHRFWSEGHDRLHRVTTQKFEYHECEGCGVVFQSTRPLASEVGRFYPAEYGPHGKRAASPTWSRLPKLINRTLCKLAQRIIDAPDYSKKMKSLDQTLRSSGTVLDFGCGTGKFLDRAKTFGCSTIGMDFADAALEDARKRGHKALNVDDAAWASIPDNTVNFVLLNHVIEHLYDVKGVLRQLFRVMAPGATLHIATPNPQGRAADTYRAAWWGLECPRHITLFSPKRLSEVLHEAGFNEVEIVHEPIVKDLVRSWAYQQVDRGKLSHESVEGLYEDGLLMLAFAPRAAKARKEGRSDRIHAIARKG